MTGEHIELIVEFSVILLAPIIHNYYLWKIKKVDSSVIQQNIRIFSFFYVLIAIVGLIAFTSNSALANDSYCYSIQNTDMKNQCLAFAKRQDSYCYSVQESDAKNRCLALGGTNLQLPTSLTHTNTLALQNLVAQVCEFAGDDY